MSGARVRRGVVGTMVGAGGLAGLTLVLWPAREHASLATVTLLYLVPVLAAAVSGGLWPALAAAVAADLLVNFFFVAPIHTLTVSSPANVTVLIVYVLVAATVAVSVDVATRQRATAAHRARRATELAEIDRLRAALLDAVGHDLRTPLAGIKAAVSSLRQADVEFSDADRAELLATVEQSTDRLTDLVENLLSLSRLRAGVLSVDARPVAVDAVVAAAVLHTSGSAAVDLAVPDDLPLALVDPGLLERVVANLLSNALAAGPPVQVVGAADGDRLLLRVVDHGPGLPADHRDRMFAPFQRFDDHGAGLGLGLAIARGFTEAMGGTLVPTDTDGGGLTMTINLPAVRS